MTESIDTQKTRQQRTLKSCFSFKGRAKRTEFWLISLGSFMLYTPGLLFTDEYLLFVYDLIVMIPLIWLELATSVRRFHDMGKSGWYTSLLFIPIVGLFFSIYIGFFKGQDDDNQYGPNPYMTEE